MLLQDKSLYPIAADAELPSEQHCDEPFLARLRARDAAAFEYLIQQQTPSIHRLVNRLLGWQNDSDDVVQEVFVAAWERIERFRGDSKIESWLYSIALNQCRKVRRRKGAWRTLFGKLCETHDDQLIETVADNQSSCSVQRIHLALNEMAQRERELIVLCCLEEKPPDKVAQLLGIRKNTLEVRLHRARKKLKQILADTARLEP